MARPDSIQQKKKHTTGREEIIRMLENIKNSVGKLTVFMQNVYVNYLEKRCQTFVAGQVADYSKTWADLTSNKEILSDIMSMRIECDDIPCEHKAFQPIRTKQEDLLIGDFFNHIHWNWNYILTQGLGSTR